MRHRMTWMLALAALLAAQATGGWAAEEESDSKPPATPPVSADADTAEPDADDAKARKTARRAPIMPIYRPPSVGKPARTVGGGSRGPGDGFPAVYALVPNHVARTASAQPSLFWYLDDVPPPSARLRFTLLDEDGIEPLVETQIPTPTRPGIHRIRLADHGVTLEPGQEYEWSVAIIVDPNEPDKDIVATGWMDCVERSEALEARLASEGRERAIHVLADEGLWYDALTEVGDGLEKQPDNRSYAEMRAALLRQVGLESVAVHVL